MQTQTEPVAAPPAVAELDAQIEAAEAELEKLNEAAEKAQNEAEKANVAFEAEPTEQSATTKLVAEQRAKNAKRLALRHRDATLAPLQFHRKTALESIEREEHREIMDPGRVTRIIAAMRDAVVEMVAKWDTSIPELVAVLEARHHATPRATELGGIRFERMSLEGAIDALNEDIAALLAGDPKLDPHKSSGAVLLGDTGTSVPILNLRIHRPAPCSAYVRNR